MLPRAIAVFGTCAAALTAWDSVVAQPSLPILAQESQQDSRFIFHEVEDGILRFDSRLGEISLCSRQSVGWTCRLVPDERSALEAEIARLERENADLRRTVAGQTRADPPDGGKPPDAAPAPAQPAEPRAPAITLPDAADLERARTVAATIWRRMVEMMSHLRDDLRQRDAN
ncbi:MAG TPA: hypothetical protein VNR11_21785 [Xanthobacteraceae bacterium]|nr:hypothetical protein [Xanthobacteraceae bacterium]